MTDTVIPILAPFDDVKKEIWESDLLVFRNGIFSRVRVAKAAWWDDELFCVEVRRFQGVVAIPLEQMVRLHPGKIDVYEVNPRNEWPDYDRQGAIRHLKNNLFSKADRRNALLETFLNLCLRLFRVANMKTTKTPCGADAIRLADRLGGGVEPLSDRIDMPLEPADLTASPIYRYRFTLR